MDNMLELLLFVDKLCKELNITYWIDGGTLLGAVRNKGFIPWDDDLDLCLMAIDFDLLVKALKEETQNHDYFIAFNTCRPPTYWTENLSDIRILKDGVIPVKIDIIPVTSIPNTEEAIRIDRSYSNIARYFKWGQFKNPSAVLDEHKGYLPENNKEMLTKKDAFYSFFHNTYLPRHSSKEKSYLYYYCFNDSFVKRDRGYYSYNDIFPVQEIDFEGHLIPCPNNVHSYLCRLYGENYRIPPAENDRIPYAYDNFFSNMTKSKVKNRITWHYEREYKNVKARASTSKIKRMGYKFLTFLSVVKSSIAKGDLGFVSVYLKFSLRHFIN